MADLFGIGLSGLKASQTNLAVTGQNITNVNTPGYSRQTALQAARDPSLSGAGYIGNGTNVVDVQRIYNEFLTNQVRSSTAINSEVNTFQTQMEELNTLLSGAATGITPVCRTFLTRCRPLLKIPRACLPANCFCPSPRAWRRVSIPYSHACRPRPSLSVSRWVP